MELQTSPQGDTRLIALQAWLSSLPRELGIAVDSLRTASSDASFRRYFRVDLTQGSAIVMDAPPPHEDCGPFVRIGQRLSDAGLRVPEILAQDLERGFLLLSDLGTHTFYQRITEGVSDAELQRLYRPALHALVSLQKADHQGLPVYNVARLGEELNVFREWYVEKHCATELTSQEAKALEQVFNTLTHDNASHPTVLVHRDYHSPNLMEPRGEDQRPGIIDYQDAVAGPITYDIASLVTDARYTWEEEQQLDWAIRYWEAARGAGLPVGHDFAAFHRAYEWMSLQRNLRILGVFVRLSVRDGKHHYLDHLPRVNNYVRQVAVRYGAFKPLMHLLDRLDGFQPNPLLVPR